MKTLTERCAMLAGREGTTARDGRAPASSFQSGSGTRAPGCVLLLWDYSFYRLFYWSGLVWSGLAWVSLGWVCLAWVGLIHL